MQSLGKIIIIFIAMLHTAWSQSVEATVSSPEVVAGNPVQLQIDAMGDDVVFPEVEEVESAPVLGQAKSSSISIMSINGKSSRQNKTTLLLQFVPEHNMTVPSYDVIIDGKTYHTKPIKITVVQSEAPAMQENAKFSLQIAVEKNEVAVGESFVVRVYFSYEDGLRLAENPRYEKPSFDGFFVQEVQEPKVYRKGSQNVQELRYILTARQEGNYTIGPAQVNIPEQDGSMRDPFGMFAPAKWTQAVSNTAVVRAVSAVPSSDLVGTFTLQSSIDAHEAKANKPVNLIVTIQGEGNLETFEIPAYDIDGVTVYSDDAKVQTDIIDGSIRSVYTKSFAFIGDHNFTIPSREFSMYNPKTKRSETLQIPAYEIKIKGIPPLRPIEKNAALEKKESENKKETPDDPFLAKSKAQSKAAAFWWIPAGSFIGGLIVMFLFLRGFPAWKRNARKNLLKNAEALTILYPHTGKSAEVEEMVRKLYAKSSGDKSIHIDQKALKRLMEQFG